MKIAYLRVLSGSFGNYYYLVLSSAHKNYLRHSQESRLIMYLKHLFIFCLLVATATAEESSCSIETVVIPAGEKIAEYARFPITLKGDWEKVLASPEVTKVPVPDTVFWTEGPLVRNGVFYASDTVRAKIYRISQTETGGYIFEDWAIQAGGVDPTVPEHENQAEPGSNGMATDLVDPNFVLINQHGLRRVIRCRLDDHIPGAPMAECPDLEVVTDAYQVDSETSVKYNSPNDIIVHPTDGSIWFTDPTYGLLEKTRFCDQFSCETGQAYLDANSEMGWKGVYRVDRDTKEVKLVTALHHRPNGLAIQGSTLWVADSTLSMPSWTSYDISSGSGKASGVVNSATLGQVLGQMDEPLKGGEGLSDGFKIDEQGYIWSSMPNGFAVIDPSTQEVICQILLGINTSNLAFGDNGDVWLTGFGGVWKMTRKVTA